MIKQYVVYCFEQISQNSRCLLSLLKQLRIRECFDQAEDTLRTIFRQRFNIWSCVRDHRYERLVKRSQDAWSYLDHSLDHLICEVCVRSSFEVFEIELQLQSVRIVQNHREVSVAWEAQQNEDSDVKEVALRWVFLHYIKVVENWSIDFGKKLRMRNYFFDKIQITLNKSPEQNK